MPVGELNHASVTDSLLRRDPGERLGLGREKAVFEFLFVVGRRVALSSPWPHPGDLFYARLVVLRHRHLIAEFLNLR